MFAKALAGLPLPLTLGLVACAPAVEHVEVRGDGFLWSFTRAGVDQQLGTEDDQIEVGRLTLAHGQPVRLFIRSSDYIYALSVPELGLNEVAVPELTFVRDLTPRQKGRYDLPVDPMCGFNFLHANTSMGEILVR